MEDAIREKRNEKKINMWEKRGYKKWMSKIIYYLKSYNYKHATLPLIMSLNFYRNFCCIIQKLFSCI